MNLVTRPSTAIHTIYSLSHNLFQRQRCTITLIFLEGFSLLDFKIKKKMEKDDGHPRGGKKKRKGEKKRKKAGGVVTGKKYISCIRFLGGRQGERFKGYES